MISKVYYSVTTENFYNIEIFVCHTPTYKYNHKIDCYCGIDT